MIHATGVRKRESVTVFFDAWVADHCSRRLRRLPPLMWRRRAVLNQTPTDLRQALLSFDDDIAAAPVTTQLDRAHTVAHTKAHGTHQTHTHTACLYSAPRKWHEKTSALKCNAYLTKLAFVYIGNAKLATYLLLDGTRSTACVLVERRPPSSSAQRVLAYGIFGIGFCELRPYK